MADGKVYIEFERAEAERVFEHLNDSGCGRRDGYTDQDIATVDAAHKRLGEAAARSTAVVSTGWPSWFDDLVDIGMAELDGDLYVARHHVSGRPEEFDLRETFAEALRAVVKVLPTRETRELSCQRCGRDYPVWFAPNELWNRVVRDHGGDGYGDQPLRDHMLCPLCFAMLAEERGIVPTAWVLSTELPVASCDCARPDERLWNIWQLAARMWNEGGGEEWGDVLTMIDGNWTPDEEVGELTLQEVVSLKVASIFGGPPSSIGGGGPNDPTLVSARAKLDRMAARLAAAAEGSTDGS